MTNDEIRMTKNQYGRERTRNALAAKCSLAHLHHSSFGFRHRHSERLTLPARDAYAEMFSDNKCRGQRMSISQRSTVAVAFVLLAAALTARADERSFGARSPAARSPASRPAAVVASERARLAASNRTEVQLAQIDSHGRYPFGQYLGGYRYPFSYPYYRYTPRRYPFGNGPYGPYGPNYGGYYSGNRYDPDVYGRPLPPAPPAPPADEEQAPAEPRGARRAAPPAPPGGIPAEPPQVGNVIVGPALPPPVAGPSLDAQPVPHVSQTFGDPVHYYRMNPFNNTYGAGQYFAGFPFGYYVDDMWFGPDRLIYGMGWYPNRNYSYFYGPPSGMGFYGPEYMPQYYNYTGRNFGPYYPGLGGINGGAGFYQGGE
jgi:hypothetical protein